MWLGIETSSLVSSVALMDEHNLIGELTIQAGLTHSEQLVPHIDMLLRASQVERNELKGIVVSIGPGSFTGLRIGCAVANTLADGLGMPIVGSSGDHWREDCLERLKRGENDMVILPEYGSEAHITAPRK